MKSHAVIFTYDLEDVTSLKTVFQIFNQFKQFLNAIPKPHFLLGITKKNLSPNTISEIKSSKIFK